MKIPRRSLLTATTAIAALAAMREGAEAASVPFTTFNFVATGEPTARNMPDRLAEVKNVKDFGAIGDNSHNDAPNIQAAIDWTTGPNRGTIYFPPGFYKCNSPLILSNNGLTSICIRGDGEASVISGNFSGAGFTLDRTLGASPNNVAQVIIEKVQVLGSGTSGVRGGIRVGSCNNVVIRDIGLVSGFTSITTEDQPGSSSQNVYLQNVAFHGGLVAGTQGLVMGGSGAITGCDWINYDVAVTLYGNGWSYFGNRIEECNTGFLLGVDSAGTDQTASGFTITSSSNEGQITFVDFSGTCNGFMIGPMGLLAHSNSGVAALSATFTGTISGNNLTVSGVTGTIVIGQTVGGSGVTICKIVSGSGTSWVVSGSSQTVGPETMGSSFPTQYGIFVRANKAKNGVFMGISATGDSDAFNTAAIEIDAASSRANLVVMNSAFYGNAAAGGVDVIPPSNAFTVQWQNCLFNSGYVPVWTFSKLPTGGNVEEGDEFSITDATTNTWGANVTTGSGSDPVLVRWNGTNYTVVAK